MVVTRSSKDSAVHLETLRQITVQMTVARDMAEVLDSITGALVTTAEVSLARIWLDVGGREHEDERYRTEYLNGHREMTLTNRELEILRWLKDGKSNSETSEIMGLSIKTIEYHVGNILKKLGAANRTTAVVIAIRRRLLDL